MTTLFPRVPRTTEMSPESFRRLLERLGPTFIKIGQYLALRPDLLRQEYCDELMGLLDRVPPFPWSEARETLRRELGRDPTEVFAFIGPKPVAAGSLAQVHLARFEDGTEVAVKVQRPGIEERVRVDLARARLLARLLQVSGVSLIASPQAVVDELSQWMERELDFRQELDNLERLHDFAADDPDQRIPRAYPDHSSRRVLTLEFLHGVPFSELLTSLRTGTEEERRRVDALGIDRRRLADTLVRVSLRQIFRNRFFHADLHPGNVLVLPHGQVGFVDFGLCEELDETIRNSQVRYLTAAASGEPERIYRAMTEILLPGETTDMEAFRRDFLSEARNLKFTRDAPEGGEGRQEQSPIARYLIGVMRSARRNDLQVPVRVLALYRTLLTLERVSGELGGSDSLRRIGGDFLARLQKEDALDTFELENLQPILLSLLNLKRDAPGQLNELLKDLADGNFNLQVYTSEAVRTERSRNRRSRLVTAAVLCVAVALLLARPELPRPFGVSLAWPLGVALGGLYLLVFRLWRQLR